jgi:hypothetical protein
VLDTDCRVYRVAGLRVVDASRPRRRAEPGGTPDCATWRDAVLGADALGVDVIFGYDQFHRPAMEGIVGRQARPVRRAVRRRQL